MFRESLPAVTQFLYLFANNRSPAANFTYSSMLNTRSLLICATAVCLTLTPVAAASTRTHDAAQASFDDFKGGDLTNLSLSNQGVLRLGPELEQLAELDAAVIWKSATDAAGNLYLGTGNNGVVFKVDPDGEVSRIFEPDEILARALAVTPDGVVYVGTSPNGRVYRIEPGRRPELYFDPPDMYIWELLFDDEGYLYVATGQRARIYRLPPDFQPGMTGDVWFQSDRSHITSMIFDNDGSLLVGAGPRAYLYRVTGENESTVLFNAGASEISQIAVDGDRVFFTTFNQGRGSRPPARTSSARPTPPRDDQSSDSDDDSESSQADSRQQSQQRPRQPDRSQRQPQSGLYQLDSSGFVELLWDHSAVQIFSFARGFNGDWLIGGGRDGELYSVQDPSSWALLQKAADGGEISAIVADANGSGFHVLTSNPARVYRLSGSPAADGEFISSVINADQISRWGRLRTLSLNPLSADGLTWQTRSGNTPEPDSTWQEWLDPQDGRIASAPGRYLQYRFEFDDPTNGLRRVQVFYQHPNVAPVVEQINIMPVGIELMTVRPTQRPTGDINQLIDGPRQNPAQQPRPRRQFRVIGGSDYVSAGWRAVDPNGDQLLFQVELKPLADKTWVLLADELDEPAFSFNTRGFADGYYQIRVTADDRLDNPDGEERSGRRVSDPFLIDNTPPKVELVKQGGDASRYTLTFKARDEWSLISSAEFVHNGGQARRIVPVDGIFDNTTETFEIVLHNLRQGSHSILIEVTDEAGNSSVSSASFEIGGLRPPK